MLKQFCEWYLDRKESKIERKYKLTLERIHKINQEMKDLRAWTKSEKHRLKLKSSQLNVRQNRLMMKEEKLSDSIIFKREQIKKAMIAEENFENGIRDINIFLRQKTVSSSNELKRIIK